MAYEVGDLQAEADRICKWYGLQPVTVNLVMLGDGRYSLQERFGKGLTLGIAHLRTRVVEVNGKQTPEHVMETLLHEMAHVVAWDLHHEDRHNRIWRKYARQLNAIPRAKKATQWQVTAAEEQEGLEMAEEEMERWSI